MAFTSSLMRGESRKYCARIWASCGLWKFNALNASIWSSVIPVVMAQWLATWFSLVTLNTSVLLAKSSCLMRCYAWFTFSKACFCCFDAAFWLIQCSSVAGVCSLKLSILVFMCWHPAINNAVVVITIMLFKRFVFWKVWFMVEPVYASIEPSHIALL